MPRHRGSFPDGQRIRLLGALAALGLLLALFLTACGDAPDATVNRRTTSGTAGDLAVNDVRILAPPSGSYATGGVALADLSVINNGSQADQLIAASSPVAASVRLLRFGQEQAQVVLAGGKQRTDGALLQLTGLQRQVRAGDEVSVTLTFRNAGNLTLDVPVQKQPVTPSASG